MKRCEKLKNYPQEDIANMALPITQHSHLEAIPHYYYKHEHSKLTNKKSLKKQNYSETPILLPLDSIFGLKQASIDAIQM